MTRKSIERQSSSTRPEVESSSVPDRDRDRTLGSTFNATFDAYVAQNCDFRGCNLDPNVIFDANKIPIEYDCEAQLADISSIGPMSETTVSVDYEALIPASADAATNARSLQWRILLAAVEDAGLDRCNMETQRYQATPQVDTLGVNTTLYAIRNDLKSSSTFNTSCTSLTPGPSTVCLPIRTVLLLKYQGQEGDAYLVQDYVHSLLEKTMTQQPSNLLVDNVEALKYVGKFNFNAAIKGGTDGVLPTRNGHSSVVRVGTLISAASAVALVIFLFAFRRRQQEENKPEEQPEAADENKQEEIRDVEAGVGFGLPLERSDVNLAAFSSGETLEPSWTDEDNADDERDLITDTGLIPITSSDSDERLVPADTASLSLPPRPPRRESVQLKTTRKRRKKKKKRPALQRISSRENIRAMQAIPESDTDGSELESEGSEYSTDEDGSSNQSSSNSTCNTPVRAHSLPGSRSGSPSLGNPFFPIDDADNSDVKFIIEALDFDFEKETSSKRKPSQKSLLHASSSSSSLPDMSSNKTPISPIKEEKKIRPLPPPWI